MDTRDELITAFTDAVPFALREMAGVEAIARETHRAGPGGAFSDLIAVIRLTTSTGESRMVLSAPETTASALARRILAESGSDVDAGMIRDCLGEVANVIAGQAKALLVGSPSHFTLSTPVVTTGAGQSEPAMGWWVIPFDSEIGDFAVHVESPG